MSEKVQVWIGAITRHGDYTDDHRKRVEFEAVKKATFYSRDDRNRGTNQVLYETPDGRLIVAENEWSHWQGEPNIYRLHEIQEADLRLGGRFEDLGEEAGYGRPLNLDEALE